MNAPRAKKKRSKHAAPTPLVLFFARQGFVHMDVAARNVLVHNNLEVKLADFGQVLL